MSTYTPPTFGSFAKSNLFQIYDKDDVEHQVKLINKTSEGVSFENGVVFTGKQPRGFLKTSFGLNGVVVDAQVQTDASKSSSFAAKKKNFRNVAGLNVAATVTSSEKDFKGQPKYGFFETFSTDYTRNNFAATAGVTTDFALNASVTASAAVGFDGFSLGGDVKLVKGVDDSKFQAKSYNAGLAFTKKRFTGALVSDAKFDKLKATLLFSKFGDRSQFSVGAQLKGDLKVPEAGARKSEVIVSAENVVSANTTYRVAVASTGVVVGTIDHRLANPSIQLTAAVVSALPASTFAPFAVSKFGVGLTVGDF